MSDELAEAERWCRSEVFGTQRGHVLKTLLAEYDRLRLVEQAATTLVAVWDEQGGLCCDNLRAALNGGKSDA